MIKYKNIFQRLTGVILTGLLIGTLAHCTSDSDQAGDDGESPSLKIQIDNALTSKTILPGIDMNIASYEISINRTGYSTRTITAVAATTQCTVNGLAPGEWTVQVRGFNSSSTLIGESEAVTVMVQTETTATCTCTVKPLPGNGSVNISFQWNSIPYQILSVYLISSSGLNIPLSTSASGANPAVYTSSAVAAGYYKLWITYTMISGGTVHTELIDILRIVQGIETSSTVNMSVDMNGNLSATIVNDMKPALQVSISGVSTSYLSGSTVSATGIVTEQNGTAVTEAVTYEWFLNGVKQSSTANSIDISGLATGSYSLFLGAYAGGNTRAGGCRVIFTVNQSAYIIADHTVARLSVFDAISDSALAGSKSKLHIAYGHTSHGSQVTDGMAGLAGWKGSMYSYNNGGTEGALDLHDYAMGGDVGYYPDWVNNTRNYLGTPDPVTGRGTGVNADVNVIVWSWCGQASSRTEQSMIDTYLAPMSQLEQDYPGIKFIYMTGHLDGSGLNGNLHLRNEQIRKYCRDNGKILFDFADIETYDPDGVYYGDKIPDDACNYDSNGDGTRDRNWATDWQSSHVQNVDWFNCSSAHSQPLNANMKAYAFWWLITKLGGY